MWFRIFLELHLFTEKMCFRTCTLLLVGYRSIGASGNRRASSDDRSFPGINMQRVTRGVSLDSSMVGCTCTCTRVCTRTYSAGGPRANESEHARVRTVAPARRICIVYIYMCVCAYVKILHNGILHNGLCPSRSWKEMKNEALLSAGSFSLACVRACILACGRAYVLQTCSPIHTFLFSPVQLFLYLSVFRYYSVIRCLKSAECGKIFIYCRRRIYLLYYIISPSFRYRFNLFFFLFYSWLVSSRKHLLAQLFTS